MLKPQDIYAIVGLQVLLKRQDLVTLSQLAAFLGLSTSETHAAMNRLAAGQLLAVASPEHRKPLETNFLELAEHAMKYFFAPEFGPPTRGVVTAAAAVQGLTLTGQPLVWPLESGESYGPALAPLYRSVPEACAADSGLHLGMAALDCLRVGRPREREAGMLMLRDLFGAT